MKETIKTFFETSCGEVTEHLLPGARILLTFGDETYVIGIGDEREVLVEKAAKKEGDIEIFAEKEVMKDIFSSPDGTALFERMNKYIRNRKYPRVKILLERNSEGTKHFERNYYHFLRRMSLLK
jgi:hypothetical protein